MKKLISLGLAVTLLSALPPPAQAQTLVLEGGLVVWIIGTTVAAGITYYVVQDQWGRQYRLPIPRNGFPQNQPQARPGPRPERPDTQDRFYSEMRVQTFGAVHASNCQKIANRLRASGYRVRSVRARRNTIGSGGVLNWICEIQTDAPDDFYFSYGRNDR